MREFEFEVTFSKGSDAVADIFIQYPSLLGTVLSISSSSSGTWQVFQVNGSQEGLEALDNFYLDHSHCNECLGDHDVCDVVWEYDVLTETAGTRIYYSAIEADDISYCHAIPCLTIQHLGNGVLFDAQRRGDRYEWTLLVRDDANVGELFDAIRDGLTEDIIVELKQIGRPQRWGMDAPLVSNLPIEQRQAVLCAFDIGYYEMPRSVNIGDIADQLGIPTSTCRYRLRQAESRIVSAFETAIPRR